MSRTIYENARILVGDGQVIEHGSLVIEHTQKDFIPPANGETPVKIAPSVTDKIVYLGEADGYTEGADETIDVQGNTLMPGLIDADTRLDTLPSGADDYVDNIGIAYRTLISYRSAAEALNAGVTTLRAVGMPNNIDIALKNAIAKTMFFGPSILATGPIYAVTAGKGHERYGLIEASGTDALRAQMRIHLSRGLDGVTLQVNGDRLETLGGEYQKEMSDAELCALVKHAHGAEKPVAVNASGDPSVRSALQAGADCIQQGYRIGDELLKEMAEKGVCYVPCLVSTLGTEIEEEHFDVVRRAYRAGVRLAVGTELLPSEPVGGTTAIIRELELFVEAGMTPVEAIAAATSEAADVVRSGRRALKEGGKPDFLVVAGKPDQDISCMREILAVVKDGRRAFHRIGGAKERLFHIHAPLYEVAGGTTFDWTKGALQGVREPENYNITWNLIKEI
ncbi:MAG: amidohydrolase family protein [Clostridiales bacterium]|nr:amidohydrolase family protein [Clostridiales bacterium]